MIVAMNKRDSLDSLPPDNPSTLGERLRWLRKNRGLTQVELAEAMGCEQTMISSWEVGRTRPTSATLVALARFHQMPLEALDEGENFMDIAPKVLESLRLQGRTKSESGAAVELRLDPAPFGKVAIADLSTSATITTDSNDAMVQFLRAIQKGREVWLVMR